MSWCRTQQALACGLNQRSGREALSILGVVAMESYVPSYETEEFEAPVPLSQSLLEAIAASVEIISEDDLHHIDVPYRDPTTVHATQNTLTGGPGRIRMAVNHTITFEVLRLLTTAEPDSPAIPRFRRVVDKIISSLGPVDK